MNIVYTDLEVENFGPYHGTQRLRFAESPPVTLVDGKNGFGKTTLLQAFHWLLYGTDHPDERTDLFNRRAAEDGRNTMRVSLMMHRGGARHTIARKVTFNPGKSVAEDIAYTIDGEAQPNPISRIRELLPRPVAQFFFFDGAKIGRYADLTNSVEVRKAIEMVLGLPAYENAAIHLGRLKARWEKELRTLQAQDQSAREAVEHADRIHRELDATRESLASKREMLSSAEDQLQELSVAMKRNEATRERIQKLEAAENRLDAAKAQLDEKRRAQAQGIRHLAHRIAAPMLVQLRDEHRHSLDTLDSIRSQYEGRQHVQHFLKEWMRRAPESGGAAQALLDEMYPEVDGSGLASIHALHEFVGALDDKIRVIDSYDAFTGIADEFKAARTRHAKAEQEVRGLRGGLGQTDVQAAKELEDQLAAIHRTIGGLRTETGNLERLEAQLAADCKKADAAVAKTATRGDATRYRKLADLAERLQHTFHVTLEKERIKKRGLIQKEATEMFRRITRKGDVYDQFRINEDYTLALMDKRGIEHGRDRISSGEKQLVALSFIVGLMKSTDRVAPLVVDTPFGHLDQHHRNRVIEELPLVGQQVVFLVTDADMDAAQERLLHPHVGRKVVIQYDSARQASSLAEVKP